MLSQIMSYVGYAGLTVGAVVGAAYGLFKLFSEKWLAQKFNEQLESYKHEQQKALEKLKLQISSTLDRTTKLHQLEFETLGKLWTLAAAAFGEVHQFTHPFQSHADLDRMNPEELAHYLGKSTLPDYQKAELLTGRDKTMRFVKMSFWPEATRVNKIYQDFNNYLIANSIFIPIELKVKFMTLRNMAHEAMFERRFEEEHPDHRPDRFEKSKMLRVEGTKLMEELEAEVHSRLRYSPLEDEGGR